MAPEEFTNLISTLSPDQQRAVEEFIQFLKRKPAPAPVSFRAALDSFVAEHPELLRRLAQ